MKFNLSEINYCSFNIYIDFIHRFGEDRRGKIVSNYLRTGYFSLLLTSFQKINNII